MTKDEDVVAAALAELSDSSADKKTMKTDEPPVAAGKTAEKKKRGRRPKQVLKFPVEPRVIQIVNKPKTFMNHSYRDFSEVPAEMDFEVPTEIENMTFSQKVHHMLDHSNPNWIAWQPHGRAFKVLVPARLEQGKVLQKYFGHSRYSSFLRQLNNFGFKHITQGPDRNCYYHEFMLRGLVHLTKYMPDGKDARRLIPDAENEPDFYSISRAFPLPSDSASSGAGSTAATAAAARSTTAVVPTVGMPRLASQAGFHPTLPTKVRVVPAANTARPTAVAVPASTPARDASTIARLSVLQARALFQNELTANAVASAGLRAELLALRRQQQQRQQQQRLPPQRALQRDLADQSALVAYLRSMSNRNASSHASGRPFCGL